MAINSNVGQQIYNAPPDNPSSIGKQWNLFAFDRKALTEAKEEMFFSQLSSTTAMPKHYGKTIKKQIFYPILDDRNVNDQGIDASGAVIANGNLYGSSKDTGTIQAKLPTLTEYGGRVNRVGFHRELIEGTFTEFGFFHEFTQDSLNFDSDAQLLMHMRREVLVAAAKMNEDQLQADLINAAGVVLYTGAATSEATITGEGAADEISVATWDDFAQLDRILTDNRTPKTIRMITGTQMIDTKTISSARAMYVSSDLMLQLRDIKDNFGERGFTPVEKYAAGGAILRGEQGSIGSFRIIEVPAMQHKAGAGATATAANAGYRTTNVGGTDKYDVYPMLVIGGEDSYGAAFTHIGFQTSGTNKKWDIKTQMPGQGAISHFDPYGKTGFSSISWFYGILIERPERIGKILTVCKI
jgi:N4-gp56 family major capsid protein